MPGPLVDTRVLCHVWHAVGPLVRSEWPEPYSLAPQHHSTLAVLDDVLAGLYLAVDADGKLRWLGKAHRDGGIGARLREHLAHAERARVYAELYVVAAAPFSPPRALAAAEGKAADLLALRGRMGSRTWPSGTGWLSLVTSHPATGMGQQRNAPASGR